MITFLEANLKPHWDADTNTFSASVQEEYITDNGWIDKGYICKKAKVNMATNSFRKAIKQVFGVAEFNLLATSNEVTLEQFQKVHVFGKHRAREYIDIFAEKGKVLTREKLFEFMLTYSEV